MSNHEHLATVVIVEHEEATLDFLCRRLADDRIDPLPSMTLEEALPLCRDHLPDLLVVDLDLPHDGGWELLRRIREGDWLKTRIDPHLLVLALLTGGGDLKPRGRDLLAADILEKPFTYDELRSRIEAILRRRHGRLDRPVRVADLLVDPDRRKVTVGVREVGLTKKEFNLLRLLASDPTRVFAREELLRDVWGLGAPAVMGRTLDSHASRLRRKLDPSGRRFVVNCWGVGYRLVEDAPTDADRRGEE
jgi:DNA-binding response OmpR family regulator